MKTGRTIQELAAELDRRCEAKKDYVLSTEELIFGVAGEADNKSHYLDIPGQEIVGITDHAHDQIASRLKINRQYYERMRSEAPELLVKNVNHWFKANPERRMIRTLDHNARAFLSDRFLRIENEDVAKHVLEMLYDHESNPIPLSTDVTDRRLYLKFLFDGISGDVKPGDTIKPGIVITNSEIGEGSYEVRGFFYRDFCYNGCVYGTRDMGVGIRRHHVGSKVIEDNNYEVFTTETQRKVHEALMAQTTDLVTACSKHSFFDKMLDRLRSAANSEQVKQPIAGVEVLAKEFALTSEEKNQALVSFIEGKDYSKWGAVNAVTQLANNTESYDRASELENIGAKILEMDLRRWNTIVNAEPVQQRAA